jgi:oligoendopeptidase F
MFADFEKRIHQRAQKNEALTPDSFDRIYGDLKSRFYNPVNIDNHMRREGMRIPHFYWSFYVYQYATGMSAALDFASDMENVREKYIEFLKSGSSGYPLEILRDAGIRMESGEPFRTAVEQYSGYLNEAEKMV